MTLDDTNDNKPRFLNWYLCELHYDELIAEKNGAVWEFPLAPLSSTCDKCENQAKYWGPVFDDDTP